MLEWAMESADGAAGEDIGARTHAAKGGWSLGPQPWGRWVSRTRQRQLVVRCACPQRSQPRLSILQVIESWDVRLATPGLKRVPGSFVRGARALTCRPAPPSDVKWHLTHQVREGYSTGGVGVGGKTRAFHLALIDPSTILPADQVALQAAPHFLSTRL